MSKVQNASYRSLELFSAVRVEITCRDRLFPVLRANLFLACRASEPDRLCLAHRLFSLGKVYVHL